MVGLLSEGMLSVLVSIGHQTGLFDAMAELPPATSSVIAASRNLDEGLVREWLAAMVTGGIVQHSPGAGTYWLPAEHAAALTRISGDANLAALARLVAVTAQSEPDIVARLRKGGQVPYEKSGRLRDVLAELSASATRAALVQLIFSRAPGMGERVKRLGWELGGGVLRRRVGDELAVTQELMGRR